MEMRQREEGREDIRGMKGRKGHSINGPQVSKGLKDCLNKEGVRKTEGDDQSIKQIQLRLRRSCSNEVG